MKRKLKLRFALPALTALLVIAGGLMPYVISRFQDAYILKNLGAMIFEPMTLSLQQEETELTPLLRLLSEERFARLEWNGETSLTATEALASAENTISRLKEAELLSDGLAEYQSSTVIIAPSPLSFVTDAMYESDSGNSDEADKAEMVSISSMLYVSEDGEFSAVVWECQLYSDGAQGYVVRIDDGTGKMIGITGPSPHLDLSMTDPDAALVATLQAERWKNFCQDYYEVAMQDCRPVYSTETHMRFRLAVRLGNSQELAISLTIYENYTTFH